MRGFVPEGFCPRGVLSQRGFVLGGFVLGGFVLEGFCPYTISTVARIAYTFVSLFPFCEEVFFLCAYLFFAYFSFVCRASSLY